MAASKQVEIGEAAELLRDGDRLGIGGVLMRRKPITFLAALGDKRELSLYSFLAGLDVDMLVALGAVSEVHTGYVGFEQLGFAPSYDRALAAGRIALREYSEMLFTAGLRATGAGLPFMPTRGARGSALVAELGWRQVTCPYSGETLTAAPAIELDVTVIHADAADDRGNVALPAVRDFLYDADAMLARASRVVVATAERIVPTDELRGRDVLLHSYEVDAVVLAPGGARPSAMPGRYRPDLDAVRAYLERAGTDPAAAVRSIAARA